jgi:hypothetical protein
MSALSCPILLFRAWRHTVEIVMSHLRFSKAAFDNMALLLATDVELREIARSFHCHFETGYRIKQNVDLFREARSAPLVIMGKP